MRHVWQRLQVRVQQHQAWPCVDDQLVAGAVVPPDCLATLQGRQAGSRIHPEKGDSKCCRHRCTTGSSRLRATKVFILKDLVFLAYLRMI